MRAIMCALALVSLAACGTTTEVPTATSSASAVAIVSTPSAPTAVPTPRPTPTPAPTPPPPIVFDGQGDDVKPIPVSIQSKPELVDVTNSGGDNFAIEGLDSNNQHVSLLVNTIGAYSGTEAMDFHDGDKTAAFKITSTGTWHISIRDASTATPFPATINGHGDSVVLYTGQSGVAAIHNSGGDNFAVTEYSGNGSNLLVNEIGAYDGKQPFSAGPSFIEVISTADWSITVS